MYEGLERGTNGYNAFVQGAMAQAQRAACCGSARIGSLVT